MSVVRNVLHAKGTDVWSVRPECTAFEALQLMAEKNIGAVLVLDGERLAGVFSERDYARKVILVGRSSRDTPVGALMTEKVLSVAPHDTVKHCLNLMTEARVRHLPVVEDEKLVGVVTIGDVVKHVISEQADTIQSLEQYIKQG